MSRHSSVQTAHVSLEAIENGVVRLAGKQYRAVLEVGSVNFGLQGEGEQEVILVSYKALLNSLTFPVQILVRVVPVEVEAALAKLERQVQSGMPPELEELARDYTGFLRSLARSRTLLERRFYVVVPADADAGRGKAIWPLRTGRTRAVPSIATGSTAEAASKQLTFRCEELARQFSRCGLTARRLADLELAQLYHACWCPELSRTQRIRRALDEYARIIVRAGHERRP